MRFTDLQTTQSSLEDIFVEPGEAARMNLHAVNAIYRFEMARTWRTPLQSIVSPVLSTSLYFVVFGAAIGSRITEVDGVTYGAFIVPGLIMLALLTAEHLQRLVRHLFPALHRHDLRGVVGAGLAARDRARLCRRGGDQVGHHRRSSSWRRRRCSCRCRIAHPVWMIAFLVLTAVTFSLFGFIIGIWADGFEKLQMIPMLVVAPLTFLGGTFYSIDDAAAVLADGLAVQSDRLSDQRLPLELLRERRRHVGVERRRHGRVPGAMSRDRVVDLQDRLPAEDLTTPAQARPYRVGVAAGGPKVA